MSEIGIIEHKPGKRAAVDALEPPPIETFDGDVDGFCSWRARNDLGNAQRFIARHGTDFIYLADAGWLAWDGGRWNAADGVRRAQITAQRTSEAIRDEARAAKAADQAERADALFAWAKESGQSGKLAAMLREAAPHLVRTHAELDARPLLLTVANGTVELGTRVRLRESVREDLITKASPVAFVEGADAPLFRRFVEDILPDRQVRDFLQTWFGYCLTGEVSEQLVALLHGFGSNGKSTLLNAIGHVMGDLATPLPFASLLKDDRRRGGEATPDLARLPGARLVTASEPETGARLSESMIKAMTSGEKMAVRHLNHAFFDFHPQFKLTLSFNNKPTIRGQDEGIWRRLLLVPFEVKVGKAEVGPVLAALDDEGPGILNWLLDGAERWFEGGLVVPEKVRAATETYRSDSDPVGQFLAECTRRVRGGTVTASRMYEAYRAWCAGSALEPTSKNLFGRLLTDRGLRREKVGINIYVDIEVVEESGQIEGSGGEPGPDPEPPGRTGP